jgi:hypothetical protein
MRKTLGIMVDDMFDLMQYFMVNGLSTFFGLLKFLMLLIGACVAFVVIALLIAGPFLFWWSDNKVLVLSFILTWVLAWYLLQFLKDQYTC